MCHSCRLTVPTAIMNRGTTTDKRGWVEVRTKQLIASPNNNRRRFLVLRANALDWYTQEGVRFLTILSRF